MEAVMEGLMWFVLVIAMVGLVLGVGFTFLDRRRKENDDLFDMSQASMSEVNRMRVNARRKRDGLPPVQEVKHFRLIDKRPK